MTLQTVLWLMEYERQSGYPEGEAAGARKRVLARRSDLMAQVPETDSSDSDYTDDDPISPDSDSTGDASDMDTE